MSLIGHLAAPDVCDGTAAVGESRHRIPRRIRGPAVINRVLTMRVA